MIKAVKIFYPKPTFGIGYKDKPFENLTKKTMDRLVERFHDQVIIPMVLAQLEKCYCSSPEMSKLFFETGSDFHTLKRQLGVPYDSAAWTGRS